MKWKEITKTFVMISNVSNFQPLFDLKLLVAVVTIMV